jgi:hypothetical protein
MSKADLFDPGHPVWNILRLFVVFVGLTALMYLNSSSFDETEIKTVVELVGLVAGFEYLRHKVGKTKVE